MIATFFFVFWFLLIVILLLSCSFFSSLFSITFLPFLLLVFSFSSPFAIFLLSILHFLYSFVSSKFLTFSPPPARFLSPIFFLLLFVLLQSFPLPLSLPQSPSLLFMVSSLSYSFPSHFPFLFPIFLFLLHVFLYLISLISSLLCFYSPSSYLNYPTLVFVSFSLFLLFLVLLHLFWSPSTCYSFLCSSCRCSYSPSLTCEL